jgi:hypothetical protein
MAHAHVFVSDPHYASRFGLCRPGTVLLDHLDGVRDYILECNTHARTQWLPSIVGDIPRIVYFTGDLVDGTNKKSMMVTDDETEQSDMAVDGLKLWCDGAECSYAVAGTEYHSGKGGKWDNHIAKLLGVKPDDAGAYARPHLFTTYDGVMFDIAHHIGNTFVPASKYTPLQREFVAAAVSAWGGEWPKADWIIRAHSHHYRWIPEDEEAPNILTLPGWQAAGPYVNKIVRSAPFAIGLCVIITDNGTAKLHRKLYKWATPKVEVSGWTAPAQQQTPSPVSQPSNSTPGSVKPSMIDRIRSRLTTTDAPAKS